MKRTPFIKVALLTVASCATLMAGAQTIQVSNEPFVDKPVLPFAAPNQPGAASKVAPVATAVPQAPIPTFELVRGKRVDEQLRDFGKRSGWDLIWQAPDFVLDQNMVIQGEFETAVLFFLKGTNEAGSRLRAVFYRGNKTVRVTEF
ncbi:MAG: TcpQ domain-containing protein [Polaromonas sp.]|uniref:TcpQ domain-containing protein n=1 Tax=Polaromonas sp. TaxID=1869339 RepID=UPI00248A24E4|nr:TcpQ domain-containing protein [Polaromonas sp.]MDI1236339.1 TcpQ domain-containing protein [Polaromonas sp.]